MRRPARDRWRRRRRRDGSSNASWLIRAMVALRISSRKPPPKEKFQ